MRKFWIVMLSLGLIMAFAMPAAAVDVKFSGSLIVRGLYASNPAMKEDVSSSYAVYDQRLRLQPEFKIAEGLVLVTRFDALEKVWGTTAGTYNDSLSFERAYVDFTTGIGRFMVGYQNFTQWGTAMADGANSYPGIKYLFATGPMTFVAAIERTSEGATRNAATNRFDRTDADNTAYDLGVIYKWTGGEAGLLYQYGERKSTRPTLGYATKLHVFDPYVKMTFGPVYVEAEAIYLTGKAAEFDSGAADVDAEQMGIYLKANVDLKPAYVGAIFVWSQGDKDPADDKITTGWLAAMSAGSVFEPCLIFGSYWYWHAGTGGQLGYAPTGWTYFWDNVWFAQVYGGVKPMPKLDVFASFSWMKADKAPGYVSKDIGYEVDVKATYKIFDNLSYMVGAAYFFTGDYFKGTLDTNKVDDNYLLLHQLTLSF